MFYTGLGLIAIGLLIYHFNKVSNLKRKNDDLSAKFNDLYQCYWDNLRNILENIVKEIDPNLQIVSSSRDERWSWSVMQDTNRKAEFHAEFGNRLLKWHLVSGEMYTNFDYLYFAHLEECRDEIKKKLAAHIQGN